MADNVIVCKDKYGEDVLNAIRNKRKFVLDKTLTQLNLGGGNIGSEGAKSLSDALKLNNTLTTLYLQGMLFSSFPQ